MLKEYKLKSLKDKIEELAVKKEKKDAKVAVEVEKEVKKKK